MNELKFNKNKKTLLGVDVGSTTVKVVAVKGGNIIFSAYERHFSQVYSKTLEILEKVKEQIKNDEIYIAIAGSAGLGMAENAGIPFVQEVFATSETIKKFAPETDVVIELGGEDAKVIFLKGVTDERMNGSCAGGTGAFIDQMATLLDVSVSELDELSLRFEKLYPIASRCGVFAKSDIQPLINDGARKEDIAASIYQSVVNQTITGLAQGYEISGNVMFLGGPLYYLRGLRDRFKETLNLDDDHAVFPSYGRLCVAIGSAIYSEKTAKSFTYNEIISNISYAMAHREKSKTAEPLFNSKEEYKEFLKRHKNQTVDFVEPSDYEGNAYIGVDCGSTTTKLVAITQDNRILYHYYSSNKGNPLLIVKEQLEEMYKLFGNKIKISASAVTGYGEALIKNAFGIDIGIVETIAHYRAAKHFNPDVDFILDIGGQDIKCFKIKNNAIDSILLNEACSSGCGSFIETFARSMGYKTEEFSKLGLFAKAPVELGSRCTVFMNSSVKQSQKDGADVSDISAGLSMSVVKNAIYKVIRANSADELGKNIVVQGGTFLNDAVLRSFEKEIGRNVVRPAISGLMGAYGAALYSKDITNEASTIIDIESLKKFTHDVKAINCNGCTNRCNLTINIFNGNKKYISGNKCEKPLLTTSNSDSKYNLYEYKRRKITSLNDTTGIKTIGLPLSLGMYELVFLWKPLFEALGFGVVLSGMSDRSLYIKGQNTIPSDTVCYPAKLMHGHIELLIEKDVDAIFYPCLTYNLDEKHGDNHYNCPVVAYYSELLNANMHSLSKTKFLYPYLNINSHKELSKELHKMFKESFEDIRISKRNISSAIKKAFNSYNTYREDIRNEGKRIIDYAEKSNKKVLILAGRPYHVDSEICHSIDKLAVSLGFVVVTEDSISEKVNTPDLQVLNQWTYHTRLYNAAQYACEHKNTQLVQLVSFGCGIDAITTDEVRRILEDNNKLYTQLKIDEINNLGTVKIRLRSLIAALDN